MPPRVLVVDDDPDILEVSRAVLTGAGYEVTTVDSGVEALRVTRTGRFDLVLLDINMPGMDGWETLRLLMADERGRSAPVVMFSVKGAIRDRIWGLQEGAADYITKPFEVDELVARVRRVLERTGRAEGPPPAS